MDEQEYYPEPEAELPPSDLGEATVTGTRPPAEEQPYGNMAGGFEGYDFDQGFQEAPEGLKEESIYEQGFQDLYDNQQSYFSERQAALNSTTMLTALARTDMSKNIAYQMGEESIGLARQLLEQGQEKALRYQLVQQRIEQQAAGLGRVIADLKYSPDPALAAGAEQAYKNVLQWDMDRKAKTAIEEAAIDRIRTMAATDPVQARVLLNNLEFGDADQTVRDFNVKLSMMRQLADEYDAKYQQSGWGRFIINQALNVIPVNFNFASTGIVGDGASLGDLFAVGNAKRNESEQFWNMPLEEFGEYIAQGGEFRSRLEDNATSLFEISDPGRALEIVNDLTTFGDSQRVWSNIWGGVEIASVVPWGKLGSATRTLVTSGAAKDAVRNLDNALTILDERGPEQMARATGINEAEIADELSVSAIRGNGDTHVPLSEPVAAHREAARKASEEILNTPEMSSFRNMEELQNWIVGRVDEIRARIGSPIKDIHMVPTPMPGGKTAYRMAFTVGKKDGFGYASAAAARRGAAALGFRTSAEIFEEVTERVVPRFTPKSTIKDLTLTRSKEDGLSFYKAKIVTESGDELPVDLRMTDEGRGTIDIGGLNTNELGAVEMRALTAKLADEIPALKTLEGERVSGARAVSRAESPDGMTLPGGMDSPVIDVTKLRGQTRIERDMSGQFFAKIELDMPEAGWLVGKLEPPQQGFVSRMIGRWTQAAPRITDTELHGKAIQAGTALNRAQLQIQNEVFGVFRGLPAVSRDMVKALGHLQTLRGRWLKPEEIDVLVQRQWGRAANEAEHKAMNDLRMFNDMDWELRNTAQYMDGISKGRESVKFKTKYGEEIDDDLVIDYSLEKVPTERVYDASRGKHYVHGRNSLDQKTLTTMKNNGYVMVTFPAGKTLPEGITVNKMLVKKTDLDIRPLRTNQLAYSEGGHRMYVAPVFVKQGRKGKQADTGTEFLSTPSTFRTAGNIAEGRKWADTMNTARLAVKENRGLTAQQLDDDIFKNQQGFPSGEEFLAGVADDTYQLDEPFEAVYDRELPAMYNEPANVDVARLFDEDELGINGYYRTTGRMFTSRKGEILHDTKGELAEILDPYDALNRSLSQVTRQLGLYTYKQNAVERFANTYKSFFDNGTGVSDGQLLTEGRIANNVPAEMRNQIESQRSAILNVLRFETPADRLSQQMWHKVTERVLGDGTNAGRKLAHDAINWAKNNDPIGAMRGLAFDMKLGMFNIGQLFIQSSTMVSAMAMSPKFGMQGMATLFPMHAYILKRGSENVLDTMVKRGVWKAGGFSSADEFKDYARHAYKNGFMQMNGSHIMINNHGPAAHFGGFAEKATAAREQARVFFYTAETWNRLVSYRIAWGEAMAKGLKPNHPEFDSFMLKTADDYSFNMTSESAAYWQKGVLSLPTQFWAYNMRMMDAMFGNRFTVAQRTRLIAMNFGIAGSAGIPGLAGLSEYIKQKNGAAPDIDTLMGAADRGAIDYFNYQMTGNDVLIGDRIGTGGWATDTVKALFGASEYGTKSFAEIAGGATYSIGKSTLTVGSTVLSSLAKYAAAESGAEDTGDILAEDLVTLFKEVSTFGNASKAVLLWQYGMYKSNKGTVQVSGLPEAHALYAALSFRPAKADEIGYKMAYLKDKEESLKEFSSKLRNWRQDAMVTGNYEKYWKKANILMRLIPVQDRQQILKQVNSLDQDSFYDYVEEKVADEQAEEEAMKGLE